MRLLDLVKLPRAFSARSPRQLSGGQKQRIGVARAFAGRPRVIIADEPMSALDVSVQAAISELLMSLQRESKTTMVFISHDLSVVRYLADRVAVMYLGHIVEMGATEQIFTPPFHPYTEALLSAIPIADAQSEEAPCGARGRDPLGAVAAEGLSVPDPLRPQARGSRRFVRTRDAADPNRRRGPHHQVPSAGRDARAHGAGVRMTRRLSLDEASDLAERACRAAGASDEAARSLARATVSAKAHGKSSIGFAHLIDYLTAFREGRIVGDAEPVVTSPAPAAIHCDARGGIAQLGFDRAFDDLRRRAETFGVALFIQNGSYTTGELGYYPRRLAEAGLVAFAATSGPALMTVPGVKTPVYCTNPIAFAAPLDEGPPLLIDQASSATAFVELRRYAERGEALPPGWASTPMDSRPPIRTRRCAARCSPSAARAAPTSR